MFLIRCSDFGVYNIYSFSLFFFCHSMLVILGHCYWIVGIFSSKYASSELEIDNDTPSIEDSWNICIDTFGAGGRWRGRQNVKTKLLHNWLVFFLEISFCKFYWRFACLLDLATDDFFHIYSSSHYYFFFFYNTQLYLFTIIHFFQLKRADIAYFHSWLFSQMHARSLARLALCSLLLMLSIHTWFACFFVYLLNKF